MFAQEPCWCHLALQTAQGMTAGRSDLHAKGKPWAIAWVGQCCPCTLVTWKLAVLLRKKGQASYCTACQVKEHHLQWTTAPLKWYKHILLRVLQAHARLLESMTGHAAIACTASLKASIPEEI